MSGATQIELFDLPDGARDQAIPILVDSFVGIYRWHAKRTLRSIQWVRAARVENALAGIAMLELLTPEVGYVYYLAVASRFRNRGIGATLLDDAIDRFRTHHAKVVYAAAEEDNASSLRLFQSRGLRSVERRELGYQDGGLGAWGLRSRMMLVSGEVLLGRRLDKESVSATPGSSIPGKAPTDEP